LLSPKIQGVPASSANSDNKYLRSDSISRANAIDLLKAQGRLTLEEAYAQMYQVVRDSDSTKKP